MNPDDAGIAAVPQPGFERSVSEPAVELFTRASSEPTDLNQLGDNRPSHSFASLAPCQGELADDRQAVVAPVVIHKLEPLPDALRSPPKPRQKSPAHAVGGNGTRPGAQGRPAASLPARSQEEEDDAVTPLSELVGRFVARICAPCIGLLPGRGRTKHEVGRLMSSQHPPHRWFRIHPMGDGRYFVRPDAGWRGRVPGSRREGDKKDQGDEEQIKSHKRIENIRRTKSTPGIWERRIGMKAPPGFQQDTFRELCCICYETPVQVITLPCRHACMCEECLRRTLFSRPAHRGGRMCPFCQRNIREVVWIYGDAAIPQYGFTIKS